MNIKALLRKVLMDSTITHLTGDKKVHFLDAKDPVAPYIEYAIYDEDGAMFAEGKEVATDYYIQVDIFSKGDYSALEDVIKSKMENAGFVKNGGSDLFEKDTQLYHKAMRFIYTTNTI